MKPIGAFAALMPMHASIATAVMRARASMSDVLTCAIWTCLSGGDSKGGLGCTVPHIQSVPKSNGYSSALTAQC
jgi:hypothetical protein